MPRIIFKSLFGLLLLLIGVAPGFSGKAQADASVKVVVGKIHQDLKQKKIVFEPIVDSVSLESDPVNQKRILKILDSLESNGTEDIAKCFIPRHAALVYKGERLDYKALICLECDGIRFYSQGHPASDPLTPVRSAQKRKSLMKQLQKILDQKLPDEP